MSKFVQLLFEKNKIICPVAAEIDMMYEDELGFIISIFTVDPTWQSFTGFPQYVAFAYDEKGEASVMTMSDSYGDIVVAWHERFVESQLF